jgi:hypothetical protein
MRYLVTTETLMSGIRATTSTGPGLDRPSMASWTPSISLLGHPRLMLITECGRLALAAHARSACTVGGTSAITSRCTQIRSLCAPAATWPVQVGHAASALGRGLGLVFGDLGAGGEWAVASERSRGSYAFAGRA